MNHPLGDIDGTNTTAKSIVDTMLDLDEFLSGDVRRAETVAYFYLKPDLEAKLDELDVELGTYVDVDGRPRPNVDASNADARTANSIALERELVQRELEESRRGIRLRQIDGQEWTALMDRHKETLAGDPPYTPDFYAEVISRSAVSPTFTPEQVLSFREKVGRPVFELVFAKAWHVNTQSGVSVPKSLLSSAVLRQSQRG